jgi:hypothetical protein
MTQITKNQKGQYIIISENILNEDFYKDTNTLNLFYHCLLKASYKDLVIKGESIKKGTFTTSIDRISRESGISTKNITRSISKLVARNKISKRLYDGGIYITVHNYNEYCQ